jgi:hypothetical protein
MVAATLLYPLVWGGEQGIHLRLVEEGNDSSAGFLERDRADLPRPFDMLRTMFADKACKGADGGKPLVTGGDGAMARDLDLGKKEDNSRSADTSTTARRSTDVLRVLAMNGINRPSASR